MNIKNKIVEEVISILIATLFIGISTAILEKLNATIQVSFVIGGVVGMIYLLIVNKIVGENNDEH